jgi:hypothetical protein
MGVKPTSGFPCAGLNLAWLAVRAEHKVIDKFVDGLKFYGYRVERSNSEHKADVGNRMAASGDDRRSRTFYNPGVKT